MTSSESPIEEDFLTALMTVCPKGVLVPGGTTPFELHNMALDDEKLDYLFVVPQMTFGPYRADFVLAAYHTPMHPKFLVVECDGHNFHLATREQINRDHARDAYFEGALIEVKRYSGRAIKRDPFGCAREAVEIVTGGKIARSDTGWQGLGSALGTALQASANYRFDIDRFDARQRKLTRKE
jgi:very-short-patch-repair endonuclease